MGSIKERVLRHNKYVPLFQQLVVKDIKLKYRRSFLGYVWSIMNPLIIMIIMVIVFSNMFRFDIYQSFQMIFKMSVLKNCLRLSVIRT